MCIKLTNKLSQKLSKNAMNGMNKRSENVWKAPDCGYNKDRESINDEDSEQQCCLLISCCVLWKWFSLLLTTDFLLLV